MYMMLKISRNCTAKCTEHYRSLMTCVIGSPKLRILIAQEVTFGEIEKLNDQLIVQEGVAQL